MSEGEKVPVSCAAAVVLQPLHAAAAAGHLSLRGSHLEEEKKGRLMERNKEEKGRIWTLGCVVCVCDSCLSCVTSR